MRLSKTLAGLVPLLFVGLASAQTPGLVVAGSDPQASQPAGAVTVAPGRFVPLSVAAGKPALLLGNDAGLLEVFGLPKGHSIIGIRFDEPAGAKAKRYTFPSGDVTIAIAGDTGGTVNLTSVVNGVTVADAPTVAGKMVLTLTGSKPPPGPVDPVDPVKPPVVVSTFRVIFVTESAQSLTAFQNAVCGAKAVREYLNAKCTKESDWPGWRNYDPQTTAAAEHPSVKAVWDAAKPKITKVPCMVVQVNDKIDILDFPANAADALATLKKYGGN